MPKATTPASARQERRHNPLEVDILATGPLKVKSGKRKSKHEDQEERYVDSRASRKILRIGQELAAEDEESNQIPKPNAAFDFDSRFEDEEEEEPFADAETWGDEEDNFEVEELTPSDQAMFKKFFPSQEDELLRTGWDGDASTSEEEPPTDLAALILEKIAAHEAAQARGGGGEQAAPGPVDDDYEIPSKVVEVYTKYAPSNRRIVSTANRSQSGFDPLKIQVRKITETLQDSPVSTPLGGHSRNYSPRQVDSECLLRSHKDIRFRKTCYRPTIL